MTSSRSVARRVALLGSAAALALTTVATAGLAPAEADGAGSGGGNARATGGLFSPLSLAVQTNGTVWVSQNFAGQLLRKDPGKAPRVVATVKNGEIGAVSVADGVVTYAVSRGNNEQGLVRQITKGRMRQIADLGAFERRRNPDGAQQYGFTTIDDECKAQLPEDAPPAQYTGVEETHPYATVTRGSSVYVADAGANAIFAIGPNGGIRSVTALPAVKATITEAAAESLRFPECTVGLEYSFEPVPTDVEVGPDGNLYVTTLPGGPEQGQAGALAAVYRVNPATGATTKVLGGLVSATGLAVAPNGDLYVNQLFLSQVVRLRKGATNPQIFARPPLPGDVEVVRGKVWSTTNVLSGLGGPGKPDGRLQFWSVDRQLPA